MTLTSASDRKALRELAEKATQNPPIEGLPYDGGCDCPLCGGDGCVDVVTISDTTATFIAGVQCFGVGPALENLTAFVRAAHPQAILGLLTDLDAAEAHEGEVMAICSRLQTEVEAMERRAEAAERANAVLTAVLTKAGSAIWTAHGCALKLKAGMGDSMMWGAAEVDWWIDAIEETYALRREINAALDTSIRSTTSQTTAEGVVGGGPMAGKEF